MSYHGLSFALMVGVAIGTAIYYYFKSENQQTYRHEYHDPPQPAPASGYDTDPRYKRRRNSNNPPNCVICYEMLKQAVTRRLNCGHVFHIDCITRWFRTKGESSCPVCRAQQ